MLGRTTTMRSATTIRPKTHLAARGRRSFDGLRGHGLGPFLKRVPSQNPRYVISFDVRKTDFVQNTQHHPRNAQGRDNDLDDEDLNVCDVPPPLVATALLSGTNCRSVPDAEWNGCTAARVYWPESSARTSQTKIGPRIVSSSVIKATSGAGSRRGPKLTSAMASGCRIVPFANSNPNCVTVRSGPETNGQVASPTTRYPFPTIRMADCAPRCRTATIRPPDHHRVHDRVDQPSHPATSGSVGYDDRHPEDGEQAGDSRIEPGPLSEERPGRDCSQHGQDRESHKHVRYGRVGDGHVEDKQRDRIQRNEQLSDPSTRSNDRPEIAAGYQRGPEQNDNSCQDPAPGGECLPVGADQAQHQPVEQKHEHTGHRQEQPQPFIVPPGHPSHYRRGARELSPILSTAAI